jgi:hypothetical protein
VWKGELTALGMAEPIEAPSVENIQAQIRLLYPEHQGPIEVGLLSDATYLEEHLHISRKLDRPSPGDLSERPLTPEEIARAHESVAGFREVAATRTPARAVFAVLAVPLRRRGPAIFPGLLFFVTVPLFSGSCRRC